jgi:hypothetical protein
VVPGRTAKPAAVAAGHWIVDLATCTAARRSIFGDGRNASVVRIDFNAARLFEVEAGWAMRMWARVR